MEEMLLNTFIDGIQGRQFDGLAEARLVESGVATFGLDRVGEFAVIGELGRVMDTFVRVDMLIILID